MSIVISIAQKGARAETIEKLVSAAICAKFPEAEIHVQRKEPAESRADRFGEAQSLVSDAKSEAEELRDELQEWHDNLPENLQSGSKADELDSAIEELESFISQCEEAESASVDFPGMF